MVGQYQGIAYSCETYFLGNRLGMGLVRYLVSAGFGPGFGYCSVYMGVA